MLVYSERKNMANFIPEYSVWKPAVSSDSASARSKGALFSSAVLAIIKITNAIIAGMCPLKIHQPLAVAMILLDELLHLLSVFFVSKGREG